MNKKLAPVHPGEILSEEFLRPIIKKMLFCCFIGSVLVSGTFFACSGKKEPEAEKGPIEKMTDQTAKDVVNQLRAPINKARSIEKQQEERIKEMNDADKKQ
jgi:hypothetical protein